MTTSATANSLNKLKKELNILLGETNSPPYSETAPGNILSTFNAAVLGQLIQTDKNLDLIPGHLESWKWDYKTSEFVLKIKKGLTFHHGRTVNSKDLEFSLLRGFFSTNQSFYRTYLSNIKGVDKIKPGTFFKSGMVEGVNVEDEFTVRVKLGTPNPSFLLGLTGPYFSFVPIEELKQDYLSWKKHPIGAGPYRVIEAYHNGVTKLERINHQSEHADIVTLHTRATNQHFDISTFESDDLDLSKHTKSLSELPASIIRLTFSNVNLIAKKPAFKNFINNAISKKDIIKNIDGYSVAEELLPKHLWGRKGLKSKNNLELARKLLNNELSTLKSEPIKLCVFSGPKINKSREKIIINLQNAFKAIGVNLEYETSLNKFTTKEDAQKFHLFISGMVADYIDPLVMFASLTKRSADPLSKSVEDDKLELLYNEAAINVQKEYRIKSLHQLSKYVTENNFIVPIAEEKSKTFYDPNTIKTLGNQNQPLTLFIDRIEVK